MWIDDQNSCSSMRFFFNAPAKSSRSGRAKFLMNFIENHWFLRLWGEFFDQNFIEFLVFFFTRAEIWLHSTSSRRKNSKTRWYGLFWAGRSWRFSGSEKEKFFEKKFGHVKNIEGKAPVVSKRPETSLGVLCSSSSSSSSSTLLKNGNVETTNSRGEHGRPMPWLTQRTGKNVFCDRVGTDFNVFDCRGSFCELPFLQNSKIRWYSRKPIETSFIKDSLRKPYMILYV